MQFKLLGVTFEFDDYMDAPRIIECDVELSQEAKDDIEDESYLVGLGKEATVTGCDQEHLADHNGREVSIIVTAPDDNDECFLRIDGKKVRSDPDVYNRLALEEE